MKFWINFFISFLVFIKWFPYSPFSIFVGSEKFLCILIKDSPEKTGHVSLALSHTVIIIAALVGTFVPIILDKQGIDPAIATGPFITTANDIFGIFLFFYIAKISLGF